MLLGYVFTQLQLPTLQPSESNLTGELGSLIAKELHFQYVSHCYGPPLRTQTQAVRCLRGLHLALLHVIQTYTYGGGIDEWERGQAMRRSVLDLHCSLLDQTAGSLSDDKHLQSAWEMVGHALQDALLGRSHRAGIYGV